MKRKVISVILLIFVLLIVLGTVMLISNPLIKSEAKIRENLLKITPIGTKMEDVVKSVESNKKWKVVDISYEHGFLHQRVYPRRTVGEKSIRVELGEYRFVLVTSVTAFWGFDENSELVDIWVWNTTDGP